MTRRHRRPRGSGRIAASILMLAVAGFASLATSKAQVQVTGNAISGSLQVDAQRSLAIQDFTVTLSDIALVGSTHSAVNVYRTDADASVRLTVFQAEPAAALASAAIGYRYGSTAPRGLEIPAGGSQSLELDCRTSPCERRFTLVAELIGAASSEATASTGEAAVRAGTATWQATGNIGYDNNWPSGAAINLALGEGVSISAAGRTLSAAIPPQHVQLDRTHPAAATVIEVRMAASAVPRNPGDAITTAVVDGIGQSTWGYGTGIEQIGTSRPAGGPTGLQGQFDPTASCTPGVECVRTYMVYSSPGYSYSSGNPFESRDFGFHVSQLWLRGAVPPADALQVRVVATLTVDPSTAQTLHFEGDLTLQPTEQGRYQRASVSVTITAPTSASTPGAFVRFAPVPATGEATAVPAPGSGLAPADLHLYVGNGDVETPFRDIHFGEGQTTQTATIPLSVSVDQERKLSGPVVVHWSIDLTLYAYGDLPPFVMTKGS